MQGYLFFPPFKYRDETKWLLWSSIFKLLSFTSFDSVTWAVSPPCSNACKLCSFIKAASFPRLCTYTLNYYSRLLFIYSCVMCHGYIILNSFFFEMTYANDKLTSWPFTKLCLLTFCIFLLLITSNIRWNWFFQLGFINFSCSYIS